MKDEGVDDANWEVNNDNDGDAKMMMMMKTAMEDVTCGSATVKGPPGPRV